MNRDNENAHRQCEEEREALRQAHERIRVLLESIGDGFVSLDGQWRFTYINSKAEEILQRQREELLGQSLWEAFPPIVATPFEAYFRKAMQGPAGTFEGFYPPLERWFEIRAYRYRDGLSIHFQDISPRKRWEENLRASEERFRNLVEQAADAFFLHEPGGRFIDVNRRACESLGYTREELFGLTVQDIETRYDALKVEKIWEKMVPGEVVTMSGMHRRKDGTTFPVEVRACMVETGGKKYLSALIRDMRAHQAAEENLRRALAEARGARDRIDAIVHSVADGLLVTDPRRRILMMNPAAEKMLGISSSQCVLRPLEEILGPGFPTGSGEYEWSPQEGAAGAGDILLHVRTSPIGPSQEDNGWVTLLRDITREKEIDRMKNEIISTAAHELRTPLATVMGFSELLLNEKFPMEQQREFLGYIHEKAGDLSGIIDDLLNLSRIEGGRPICLNKSYFNLREGAEDLIDQYRSDFSSHAFEVDLPSRPLTVWMDRVKIHQALDHVLSNAVLYSPQGGRIGLRLAEKENGITLIVEDEGIGMSSEQVRRIFDPFYRADASNTAVRGLGLGMSMVKAIVEAHQGTIEVESVPGRGTRVRITLPTGTL